MIFIRVVISSIVFTTLLSLTGHVAWNPYLELAAHFKLQYWVICLLLTCGLVGFHFWKLHLNPGYHRALFLALFCLGIQLIEILPWYFPPAWLAAPSDQNFRILLSNVYVKNPNHEKVLNLVQQEQPDVAIFQEVDEVWSNQLQTLRVTLPYSFQAPDDLAIYSRIPLENPMIFGSPTAPNLATRLTINQQTIQLVVAHPLPPKPDLIEFRNAELNQVSRYIQQQIQPQKMSVILVGDLNMTMWSPYYKKFVEETRLKNTRQGFGVLPTWPITTPFSGHSGILSPLKSWFAIPLDHCLVSPEIKVATSRTGPPVDSDHLPLITDLLIQ